MCGENMAKNRPKCCQNRQNFGCSNLWKSIFMTVEKPGKLGGIFFSYFEATLDAHTSLMAIFQVNLG